MSEPNIETIAGWLREAKSIVILAGAGISTESGIPDFRGPQGVWTKNPGAEEAANIQNYMSNPRLRAERWKSRAFGDGGAWAAAEPNAGHIAITEMQERANLGLLVTQNIDGLHHRAGTDPERIVEIHGNVREFMCMGCDDRGPLELVLDRVRAGEDDPPCKSCGGVLKTATISFGQGLVMEDLYRSQVAAGQSDVFIAIGTSLTVYPVAELPAYALQNGAKLVILNAQETPYDPHAHAIERGQIGQVLPEIVSLL